MPPPRPSSASSAPRAALQHLMPLLAVAALALLGCPIARAFVQPLATPSRAVPLRALTTGPTPIGPYSCGQCRSPAGPSPLQSTASGASEASTGGGSSGETVLWLRGLSNTFDGTRYQFKDISLSLAKGAWCCCACLCVAGDGYGSQHDTVVA